MLGTHPNTRIVVSPKTSIFLLDFVSLTRLITKSESFRISWFVTLLGYLLTCIVIKILPYTKDNIMVYGMQLQLVIRIVTCF